MQINLNILLSGVRQIFTNKRLSSNYANQSNYHPPLADKIRVIRSIR